MNDVMKNITLEISLDISEKSPNFVFSGKHKMISAEVYNPSLFYMQFESNITHLKKLMDNMM